MRARGQSSLPPSRRLLLLAGLMAGISFSIAQSTTPPIGATMQPSNTTESATAPTTTAAVATVPPESSPAHTVVITETVTSVVTETVTVHGASGCEQNPPPCSPHGVCMNTPNGSFNCSCNPGYELTSDKTNCTETDECASNLCQNGGTCVDIINNYTCSCAPGYTGDNCQTVCQEGLYGTDCAKTCTCVQGANCSHVDGFCTCDTTFDGQSCNKNDLAVTASFMPPVINEKDTFILICEVNLPAQDLVSIAWFNGSTQLTNNNTDKYSLQYEPALGHYNINVTNATATDTGMYHCIAHTDVSNSSATVNISVIVIGQIIDGDSVTEVMLHESAILNCTAFSSEELSFRWERNDAELNETEKYNITSGEAGTRGGSFWSSILTVEEVAREDNGTYRCVALNSTGGETSFKDFEVVVLEPPELSEPRYANVTADSLTLAWTVGYLGNSDILYCTANYSTDPDSSEAFQNLTLEGGGRPESGVLNNLTAFTVYTVSLLCENAAGRSDYLHYPPNKTSQGVPGAPTNVTVDMDDIQQKQIPVSWSEPNVINGLLEGYSVSAVCAPADQDGCNNNIPESDDLVKTTSATVTGLTPGARYIAQVVAINTAGIRSVPGKSAGVYTLPALPGAPENFASKDGQETCILTWSPPSPPNGNISGYTIYRTVFPFNGGPLDSAETKKYTADIQTEVLEKNTFPYYSRITFTISATNEVGEGERSEEQHCERNDVNTPAAPADVPTPAPGNIGTNSFTVQLPAYDDRYSPVSCYEVIVMRISDANAERDPSAYPPGDIKSYTQELGVPYTAIVYTGDRVPENRMVTIGNEISATTTCDTRDRTGPLPGRRSRRAATIIEGGVIEGTNGPLRDNGLYTLFVRVYSPTGHDQDVYYENGDFMTPIALDKTSNAGAVAGGVIGGLIAAALVIVIFLFFYRRRKPLDDQLVTTTENHRNGNGVPMGIINPGIEDDEMIVKPIPLESLEKEIRRKAQEEKKIFWQEYKSLPNQPAMVTTNASNHPANKDKNRYINIIAYDHTRVKLKTIDGVEGSDYINASYVNGYQAPDKFIAAQGPKDNTIDDFWRMIWEQGCSTIVMLTKCVEDGKDKCSQYWPDGGTVKYGKLVVTKDTVKNTAEYVIRTFFLHEDGKEDQQRSITQFHFLGWPDHGQPDYPNSMLCLINRVRHLTSTTNDRANIIIHCSAGVGRTGTYIVIDAMMDMMKNEKRVDIYNFIHEIRQQRNTLVQSFVQYFFIHMALLEHNLFQHTDVSASSLPQYYSSLNQPSKLDESLTKLELEFRRAAKLPVQKTEQTFANLEQNKEKNRILHILPFDKNVVKLQRLLGVDFSDYINASYITGHQRKGMYIATQGPLPNTISDFWRMAWESQTSTIVMLTETSQKGHEMCAQYWPVEPSEPMVAGDITITLKEETDEGNFTIRDIEISHSQMDDVRQIRQYHYRGWPEVGVPETGLDLVSLVNRADSHQAEHGEHPIIVHCSAGSGRTGVFIALSILLGRMEEENMVDVFQTVRGLRQQRPHMVQDLTQYRFCYTAISEYLENQSTEYQNFVPRV